MLLVLLLVFLGAPFFGSGHDWDDFELVAPVTKHGIGARSGKWHLEDE